jgi:hypothetical protein
MQPLKNFPAFYGTQRFIIAFTRSVHWPLSWATSIQSVPSHPRVLSSILILSLTYVLVFQMVSFLLDFLPISYMPSSSLHSCYMPRPCNPPWLDHSNYTWRRVEIMKLLKPPVTSSLFGPTIINISTAFSTTELWCLHRISAIRTHISLYNFKTW